MPGHLVNGFRALGARVGRVPTRTFATACLRGIAQLAFLSDRRAGVMVLAAIAVVSPWSALGGLIGVLFGTALGRMLPNHDESRWREGLAGFNPAIIGILWGGFFASGTAHAMLFALVLAGTCLLEALMTPALEKRHLPSLSLPASLGAVVTSWLLAPPGEWFWVTVDASPLGARALPAAVACVLVAMALRNVRAAAQAAALAGVAGLAGIWLGLEHLTAHVDYWGYAVALPSFAVHAAFLRGTMRGSLAGLIAALAGATAWWLWAATALSWYSPPLLFPLVLGVWAGLGAQRLLARRALLSTALWRLAAALCIARCLGRKVCVLVTARAIEVDAWMDPRAPRDVYRATGFVESPRYRRVWWEGCERFRREAARGSPDPWLALEELRERGWIEYVISARTDVHQPPRNADRVIGLHGTVQRVRCCRCHKAVPWPPAALWRHHDLYCQDCHGLMRPDVRPSAEPLPPEVLYTASSMLEGSALVVVVGPGASEPVCAAFIRQVQGSGARLIRLCGEVALERDGMRASHAAGVWPLLVRVLASC